MCKRVLSHSVHELSPSDEEFFRLECNVLNERLKHLKVDVSPHREGGLQHFDFSATRSIWQCVEFDEHA